MPAILFVFPVLFPLRRDGRGHPVGRGRSLQKHASRGSAWPSLPLSLWSQPRSASSPRCPAALERTHKGPGSPRPAAWLFLWALSGFLWLVVRCLREAPKLWVESDARIQLGLTQLRCAPRDLRAVITATAGMSSAHFTRLLFKRFMHARSEEA